MNEKFSIVRIDLDKLNRKLIDYMCKTGETNPYVFMNKETARKVDLSKSFDLEVTPFVKGGMIARFNGCKTFINDDLDFGEIEIR